MSKPHVHALSSARKYGGKFDDYITLHNFLDSSKEIIADDRHRACFHHAFGIFILEQMFGVNFGALEQLAKKFSWSSDEVEAILAWKKDCTYTGTAIKNSDNKVISVRDIGEQHVLEDFGNRFIPSAQDYLSEIENKEWMICGKGKPPSCAKLNHKKEKLITFD